MSAAVFVFFLDRLAKGGELCDEMLHCCSHMLSGGGENSISFNFGGMGSSTSFGDKD